MTTLSHGLFRTRSLFRLCLLLSLLSSAAARAVAGDFNQQAVDRACRFLNSQERSRSIIGVLHLGTAYHGCEFLGTSGVTLKGAPVPGEFALSYRYYWGDDGQTNVAFFCDRQGRIESLTVTSTNAEFNQPFLWANASIQIVGEAIVEAMKDDLTFDESRTLRRFIAAADAEGLLEWSLRMQQANE